MRSVVVVLPASMWAMMPMLRTLFRSVSTSCATVIPYFTKVFEALVEPPAGTAAGLVICRGAKAPLQTKSPAVVREGLVGLGHLVGVLATLHRGAEAVRCVEDLVGESL